MKIEIFVSDDGPESRQVEEIGSRISETGTLVNVRQWEDDEVVSLAALYDIQRTPALLITKDDGTYIELWQGEVPSAQEVLHRTQNG